MKKRILYVASTYNHIRSFHLDYIDALRQNYDVDILSKGKDSTYDISFTKSIYSLTNLKVIHQIKKIIKNNHYDAIILNTSLAAFLVRLALKKNKNKRPLVINIVHGYLFNDTDSKLKFKLMLKCEQITRKKTDFIITMNKYDYDIARKYQLANKVYNIDGLGIKKHDRVFVNPYEEDKYNLLYVAEFSKRKNQMFLLETLNKLKDKIPNIHLTLLGVGNLLEECKKYVKDSSLEEYVSFKGYVPNPTPYYEECDLYVSSSHSEGLPFNIIEAVEFNKPVICSKVKGHTDIEEVDHYLSLYENQEDFINKVVHEFEEDDYKDGTKTFNYFSKERVFESNLKLISLMVEKSL